MSNSIPVDPLNGHRWRLDTSDALDALPSWPSQRIQTVVTSPPYYGITGQIGLEPTRDAYIARLVEVFRELRRVLRNDGTVWLNLGDGLLAAQSHGADCRAGVFIGATTRWKLGTSEFA
jgi:DNA modification methylase